MAPRPERPEGRWRTALREGAELNGTMVLVLPAGTLSVLPRASNP